jgi:ABC-type sugar transport system substrate-binding protein
MKKKLFFGVLAVLVISGVVWAGGAKQDASGGKQPYKIFFGIKDEDSQFWQRV